MKLFHISLLIVGSVMAVIYLLFRIENSVKVSRVFYNDDGIDLPGLLICRAFRRPIFFPFEAVCGFDSQVIYKEDEALIRPMSMFHIVNEVDGCGLCLSDTVKPQVEKGLSNLDTTEIPIHKDKASEILEMWWIACYMLYDWNIDHANYAFDSNEFKRHQNAREKLKSMITDKSPLETVLTDTYNRVLLDDTESFIQNHMRVWKCDRLTVEYEIIKVIAELFYTD